jgi:hypothetical protein
MKTHLSEETDPGAIQARRIIAPERRADALGGVGSRLLTTMAVMVATADEGRDYLSFFTPFLADRLKAWPEGQPVEPHEMSKALCDGWGFPMVPAAVSQLLLQRAEKDGMVTRVDRMFYVSRDKLLGVTDLAEKKQEMLAGMNALALAVVAYAREVHELGWTEIEANAALERLTEEFGADLATARREGGLVVLAPGLADDQALAVVHGFARRAISSDPTNFNRLVAMVQGTMIANVLYFEDVRKLPNRLPELRVYLDTTPLLRALGLASPEVVTAALEMLALMGTFKIPMLVFSHTIDEMTAILENVAASVKRGTQGYHEQGALSGRKREAIDSVIKAGITSGEIHALIADIENRLVELGVRRCETPTHLEAAHIDETKFGKILDEVVAYQSKGPMEKDLNSLAAVDRLRGTTRPRDLSQARALFVTANNSLARASRSFFRSIGRSARVPHCMTDVAITAELWVRSSNRKPDLPRRLLIADCYSGLNPGPELWERWVGHIVKLRERGVVTDEQLQALIYHQQTKALLYEVSHGDPNNVNDAVVAEVLARYEAELRRPAEEAAESAEVARVAAEAEQTRLTGEVAQLTAWRREQEEAEKVKAARRAALRGRARLVGGHAGAGLALAAFVVLGLTGVVHGRTEWATSSVVFILVAASSWAWGVRRPVHTTAWRVMLGIGAATALWFGVFNAIPDAKSTSRNPPAAKANKARAVKRHAP